MLSKFKILSNNQLKIIAMVTMLLDHAGKILFPQSSILMILGRISFPIFAYMIAEGCTYTKNRSRYLLTLLFMAIAFQTVYFIVLDSWYLNILFTFTLSITTIYCIDLVLKNKSVRNALLMLLELCAVVFICIFLKPLLLSDTDFKIDYGFLGVMLPVAIYFTPKKTGKIIVTAVILCIMALISFKLKWFALLSIPFLALYNGKRGKANLKYMFYIFYPAHFVVLYGIKILLNSI